MARGDVADFVAEDSDELRFVVEIRQDAARDVDEPARQRKRVDRGRVDDGKAPRQVRALRASRDAHAEILHVALQFGIFIQPHFLADLRVELASDRNLLLFAHEGQLALARHRIGRAGRHQHRRNEREHQSHMWTLGSGL